MYVEFGLLANVFDTYVYFLGQFLGWLHKKRVSIITAQIIHKNSEKLKYCTRYNAFPA